MRYSWISESSVSMFKVNYVAFIGQTLTKVNAAALGLTKPYCFQRTFITSLITEQSNLSNLNIKGMEYYFVIIEVLSKEVLKYGSSNE